MKISEFLVSMFSRKERQVRLCKDCAYYSFVERVFPHRCSWRKKSDIVISLITGKAEPSYEPPKDCTDCRRNSGHCGSRGKHWEPR